MTPVTGPSQIRDHSGEIERARLALALRWHVLCWEILKTEDMIHEFEQVHGPAVDSALQSC